jgi:hypothetical protein
METGEAVGALDRLIPKGGSVDHPDFSAQANPLADATARATIVDVERPRHIREAYLPEPE